MNNVQITVSPFCGQLIQDATNVVYNRALSMIDKKLPVKVSTEIDAGAVVELVLTEWLKHQMSVQETENEKSKGRRQP